MSYGPLIKFRVGIDDCETIEALSQTARAVRETFEQTVTTSLDKAQKKLYELNRDLQNHVSIIENNKRAITDLEAEGATANQAEMQRINSEIEALSRLNQQRTLDASKLEEKKTKVQALIAATTAASEQEKLGIQLTTQQRLIEIGVLRDQQKAVDAIRDTSEKGAQKMQAAIDALISRQLAHHKAIEDDQKQIEQLYQTHNMATEAARSDIEQEISSLKRAIATREQEQLTIEQKIVKLNESAQLSHASSEAERQQIAAKTQARMGELAAQQDQLKAQQSITDIYTADTDERLAQIDAITAKQKSERAMSEDNRRQIDELRNRRAQASGEERRQIDAKLEGYRKVQAAHEVEILSLEERKVKIQEEMHLAIAGSESERQAIRAVAEERRVEIGVQKDAINAQRGLTETTNAGTSVVLNYLKGWLGLQGVMFVIRQVNEALRDQARILTETTEATNRLREAAEQAHQTQKTFNSAFGLMDQSQQATGSRC